jgi:hypothetical protein
MPGRKYPFKISSLTKGAQKARQRMMTQYGKEKGEQVWLDKAREQGQGNTDREKLNSVYKKGAKLGGGS